MTLLSKQTLHYESICENTSGTYAHFNEAAASLIQQHDTEQDRIAQ